MRKYFLLLLLLFYSFTDSIAQTIENPAFERSDVPTFRITKVKITKDTTFVFCSFYAEEGSWANISKNTYLRDSKTHVKYPILRSEGLPYSPDTRDFYQKGNYELLFCFPSIAGTEQFDFIESEGEMAFNIFDIDLNKKFITTFTDEDLHRISDILSTYDSSDDTEKTTLLNEYATSLNNLKSYYASMDNYEEAIRLGTEEAIIKKKVFGTEDPIYVKSLQDLATFNKELKNLTEAIRIQQEVTILIKSIYGINHVEYAYSLANLADYYFIIGNNNEAIRIGTEVIGILKRIVDTYDSNYAGCLNNLAYYYYENGNYRAAIRFQTELTDVIKTIYGAEHPYYATSLSQLGDYYTFLGNFQEALQLGTEALRLKKITVGVDHPEYAKSLNNLARLYSKLGNYTKAISLGIEAMEIEKKTYGTESSDYATSLNNLAGYYEDIGNYSEAIRLGIEAMNLYKNNLGAESSYYATSLNNLAGYYKEIGNYSEAIRLGIEAMNLYKRVLGTEHPLYALSLSNLANYISKVGNYSEAIRLVTEAIVIYKKIPGTEHPNYVSSLNILAINNAEVGNYEEAIRIGTEAKTIIEKVLGTENPDYAMLMNGLAYYYSQIGNYDEAIKLGTKATEIRKRILGTEHPHYATSLLNLAIYDYLLGNYDEAIKLGNEAMEILKKNFGTGHPDYSISLNHIAQYYAIRGDYIKAFRCLQHCLRNSQSFVLNNFTELSSNIQEKMWTNNYSYVFNSLLPCVVTKNQTKQTISELYDKTCIFAKGILLNTGIEIRKLILESGDSVMIEKYNILSSNIGLYNKLLEKPIKERFMNVDSLNRVIELQEMELARKSKAYGDYTHNLTISWKDVQKGLGDNDIAIEFLDFPIYGTDSTMYVALTLKKDYDSPHMVTLFEEKQLKSIPENVYYTQTDVSDLIWKPLEEELRGVRNIYFAPSGELHRIGIEYLLINKTKTIGDVYMLHRLSSTRQLAIIQDKTIGEKSILYGGINYDEKTNAVTTDTISTNESVLRSSFIYRANLDSLSLRNSYEYLEGTKREADLIAEDMKRHSIPYNYYSGSEGTEESFKKLDGSKPKVMHIATHGFYFTGEESVKSQFARPEIDLLNDGGLQAGRIIEQKPMTRSGLLFSGCNRIVRHEKVPDEEEDGILTAQEISTLDLRGLDLVVLSACQTGLGDIISGEGVFGLQRGFKKAGAKTIIMSLWNVNDESTMKMMTSFYHHYLEGMSKEKAFHTAQDELRKDSLSQQERPDWAAFILLDGIN